MKHTAILASVATLALAAGSAWAVEDPPPPETSNKSATICAAYGPGYENVPGTDTCLRVGGSLEVEATFSFGGGKPTSRSQPR